MAPLFYLFYEEKWAGSLVWAVVVCGPLHPLKAPAPDIRQI